MNANLSMGAIVAFLLVLARVGGLVAFLPVPGFRNAPDSIRIVLAVAITLSLFPVWPHTAARVPSFGELTAGAFAEAGFGLAVGLAVAFLTEAFQLGCQVLGMQAGYGYASTIDPSSQADSGIIQVMMSLVTGLLFFTSGTDRAVIRILGLSFERYPAGSWAPAASSVDGLLQLGAGMFTIGLRLAMPVIALLLLLDIAMALLGRMQQQLQLLSVAFPLKMLATVALLAVLAPVVARMFAASAQSMLSVFSRMSQ